MLYIQTLRRNVRTQEGAVSVRLDERSHSAHGQSDHEAGRHRAPESLPVVPSSQARGDCCIGSCPSD